MNLRKLENKYPITLIGLIVSLAYIVYVEFIREEKAELTYSVISNSNVFDINEPVPNLEIVYADRNLLEINENLRIFTLKIENTGSVHLTENMYYSGEKFGFSLKHGTIIETPEVLESGSLNLQSKLRIIDSLNFVELPKIPMDKGESYTIKALYFGDNEDIQIEPHGKITGIGSIKILNRDEEPKSGLPIWKRIIQDISILLGVFFLLLIINSIVNYIKNCKTTGILNKFKKRNKEITLPNEIESLFQEFGKDNFMKLEPILTDSAKFKELLQSDTAVMKGLQTIRIYDPILYDQYDDEYCKGINRYPLRRLIRASSKIYNHPNNPASENPKDELNPKFISNMKLFFEFLKHN